MSPNPSRGTTAGRVFNDLRNMARREGRSTDELLVFYVLERFLHRVSRSPYADQLVLKGGLLLAVLNARRSTRDADLLALELDRDEQRVMAWVSEIASADIDDGVVFAVDRLRSQKIREGNLFPGVRITVPVTIGTARLNLVLDVNFGDPVTPGAIRADFPQLLDEGTFPMWGYPVETVVAEKLIRFADPLISDQVGDQRWRAVDRVWSAADHAK